MKRLLTLLTLIIAVTTASVSTAEARPRRHDDHRDDRYHDSRHDRGRHDRDRHYSSRDRTRTIYVIERNRPVARVVYLDSNGRYYRKSSYGRRTYVTQRYYTSYPTKHYYRDGRPRISISF